MILAVVVAAASAAATTAAKLQIPQHCTLDLQPEKKES
jgi:hypothetical protein